ISGGPKTFRYSPVNRLIDAGLRRSPGAVWQRPLRLALGLLRRAFGGVDRAPNRSARRPTQCRWYPGCVLDPLLQITPWRQTRRLLQTIWNPAGLPYRPGVFDLLSAAVRYVAR